MNNFRLQQFLCKQPNSETRKETKKTDEITADSNEEDIIVERVRIENLKLRFPLLIWTDHLWNLIYLNCVIY